MSGPARLELDGLTKRFGDTVAVRDVDLAVTEGEFFTLVGPSGSGKTTILRLIAGFERATAGRVMLDGHDLSRMSPADRGIGVVFQHYALFPHMTVSENVAYPLRMRRLRRALREPRVRRALELVRLEGHGDRLPAHLSGGQQQRVALARALVFDPSVLLMDEPLGALDRALRLTMEGELRRIHRQTGATVIHVTHDQEEALVLSDRIGVLAAGRLLQAGTPREVFEAPADEVVARFLGDCNLLPIEMRANGSAPRWRLDGSRRERWRHWQWAPPRDHSRLLLLVRPSRLRLRPPGSGGVDAADIHLDARVADVAYLGDAARVVVESRLGLLSSTLDARVCDVQAGDRVGVSFDPSDAAVVPAVHGAEGRHLVPLPSGHEASEPPRLRIRVS